MDYGWTRNPVPTFKPWLKLERGICVGESSVTRVSWVVQDFVHPQYGFLYGNAVKRCLPQTRKVIPLLTPVWFRNSEFGQFLGLDHFTGKYQESGCFLLATEWAQRQQTAGLFLQQLKDAVDRGPMHHFRRRALFKELFHKSTSNGPNMDCLDVEAYQHIKGTNLSCPSYHGENLCRASKTQAPANVGPES